MVIILGKKYSLNSQHGSKDEKRVGLLLSSNTVWEIRMVPSNHKFEEGYPPVSFMLIIIRVFEIVPNIMVNRQKEF